MSREAATELSPALQRRESRPYTPSREATTEPSATAERFWQPRYYDFNIWTERKRIEKLRYLHRNPVKRGLVACPEDWEWSSFRHYATGIEGVVEIESEWTGRKRQQIGLKWQLKQRSID